MLLLGAIFPVDGSQWYRDYQQQCTVTPFAMVAIELVNALASNRYVTDTFFQVTFELPCCPLLCTRVVKDSSRTTAGLASKFVGCSARCSYI